MKPTRFAFAAQVGALALLMALPVPVTAAPIAVPEKPTISSDVIQVQSRRRGDRFERRGDRYFLNGRRGFRDRRPGYRRYRGFWFPPAAFLTGALVGGALAQSRPRRVADPHVEWCFNRFRSYDPVSDTFQPFNGPRRRCISPYS